MNYKKKYPFLNILLNYKLWSIVVIIAVCLQIFLFYKKEWGSINFLTGILFWSFFWWIAISINKLFGKNQKSKKHHIINAIFLSLLILEIIIRIIGIVANWAEQKHGHYMSQYGLNPYYWIDRSSDSIVEIKNMGDEFHYKYELNSHGFNDREWNINKLNSKKTIIAFGDSYTEGYGTSPDSTWIRNLEQ